LNTLDSPDHRGLRAATLLSITSGTLAVGAAVALLVGWFWAGTRGDWQAFVLWGYWFTTPFLCGLSLAIARRRIILKRVNFSLLILWGFMSFLVLVIPLLL